MWLLFVGASLNALGRDNHIAAVMLECLCYRLNAIAAVLSDKAFNPSTVIAVEYQILGALNNQAVNVGDFFRLEFVHARLEFRE
jgi:hypothetical protein